MDMDESAVKRAAGLIASADALMVGAGAGMGVDSGLPDFRGKEGFWRAYPALRQSNVDFYNIASPAAFYESPERAWGFYGHRLALYRKTTPHSGFARLKRWGECLPHGVSVFTSNVDGQFQKAGFDLNGIHECHGSIQHLQCLEPCCGEIWSADDFQPEVDTQNCLLRNPPPHCPHCGGMARPNVLMFGDSGWIAERSAAQGDRQEAWLSKVRQPVVIELGAGTAIPSVRHFSRYVTGKSGFGGRLIRINPNECEVQNRQDVSLKMGAAAGLAAIAEVLGKEWM
jgi:NAD-dependent SIR2 family protein deacetylase